MNNFFTLIIVAILFVTSANAQIFTSNFDNWASGTPTDWFGTRTSIIADSAIQVTGSGSYGTNAVQLVNTGSSHKRFTTQNLTPITGQSYEIKFWAKGVGQVRSGLIDSDYRYADYIDINTTFWTEYTQVVTCVESVDTAQFMLSLHSTTAADHIIIDKFEVNTTTAQSVSIYDIQYTTDVSGDSPYNGQTINTGGIVSCILLNGKYFLQSGVGAWNGVYVYDFDNTVNYGDSVTLTATVSEYNNLTELTNIANFTIVSSGNSLYAPVTISTNNVNTEQYEGVLVKVINAKCTSTANTHGVWTVDDNSGNAAADDQAFHFDPTLNVYYDVTGPVDYSYDEFKILPRGASDIEIATSVNSISNNTTVNVYPNPASNYVFVKTEKTVSSVTFFNIVGEQVKIVNNSTKIEVSDLTEGIYILNIEFTDNTKSTIRLNIK